MNRIIPYFSTFFLICAVLIPGVLWSDAYYVSPSGNDRNPGTLTEPWRSLSKANHEARPGDTIFIRAGIYHEDINPVRSGSAGDPIVFMGYPGEEAEIQGAGKRDDEAVVALGYPGSSSGWGSRAYVIIRDLVIATENARYGVAIYGSESEHIEIRNCRLIYRGQIPPRSQGILLGQARYTLIENNEIVNEWNLGIITTGTPRSR